MNAIIKRIAVAVIILIGFNSLVNATEYKTNKSGGWNDNKVWSKKSGNKWNSINNIGYTFSEASGTIFNIQSGDTIIIAENETVVFNGNNNTFNIFGLLIINGTFRFEKNNTDLEVNGNMIVNGNVEVNGGGNSSISGNGTISISDNGTFKYKGKSLNPNDYPTMDIIIGENSSVCAPFNLDTEIYEYESSYDVKLIWEYDATCEATADFSHFEVSRDGDIIAFVNGTTKSDVFTYTDAGQTAEEAPLYAVAAVYTNPAARSSFESFGTFQSPLPIDLIYFNAKSVNNTVELEWATATEINNNFFTIEKSVDGTNWDVVSYLQGAGNSNYTINYSFTDESPVSGISYYRLKQTDFDGKFEYFAPVAVSTETNQTKSDIVNVTFSGRTMNIAVENQTEGTILMVADIQGRIHAQVPVNATDYTQQITVDFQNEFAGEIIILKLINSNSSAEKKFLMK